MNKSVELLVEKIELLARTLRVDVEEIFPYFVKGVVYGSWGWIAMLIPLLLMCLYGFWHVFNAKSNYSDKAYEFDNEQKLVWSLVLFIPLFFIMFGIVDSVIDIINPYPDAIRNIMNLIK